MSLCCRVGCLQPQITYDEWCYNDGACDVCAALYPSLYFLARSHDDAQEVILAQMDARWPAELYAREARGGAST